jgi:hypothetical protein
MIATATAKRPIILLFFLLYSACTLFAQSAQLLGTGLLPGAKVYDVTKPELWGGDPALAATPDNPADDDALGIHTAMQAAVDFLQEKSERKEPHTYQQIIALPAGTYHVETSIVVPKNEVIERFIWLYGEGQQRSILRLKPAAEIGLFGEKDAPKPVLQFAQYTLSEEGRGNSNFQLFATDLAIEVPADQPHAVGLSYGSANMGGVRRVHIKAEGAGGHTGLALVQYNNGPGWVEHVSIEGFGTGLQVADGWGEGFALSDITVRNQKANGVAVSIADKQLAIEDLHIEQREPDVRPIVLLDDPGYNSEHGGAPHLTCLRASIRCSVPASVPAIEIHKGHSYLRHIRTDGYGQNVLIDHGKSRSFDKGMITEYISVHGKTPEEKSNVAVTINAPAASLQLPAPATPEVSDRAFNALAQGNYTLISHDLLANNERIDVNTDWAVVDPAGANDDTRLLQAALNSGARYIGLLNMEPFQVSETIDINAGDNKRVELIYGLMSEINASEAISQRSSVDKPGTGVFFRIAAGTADTLIIKGLRLTTDSRSTADFLLIENRSPKVLVFEDIRSKDAPRHYRNTAEARGGHVYYENVEFACNGIFNDAIMLFDQQQVWARQFNLEAPITKDSISYKGKRYTRYTTKPKLLNRGGEVWVLSQKFGEHNGIFAQTEQGGKTELLSVFYNAARTNDFPVEPEATNFLVQDKGSAFSMVGQERIRTRYTDDGLATQPLPHANRFGKVAINGEMQIIDGTA